MALLKPEKTTKFSLDIPLSLKARLDAVAAAAKAQGFEFDLSKRLTSSIAAELARDEKALGIDVKKM